MSGSAFAVTHHAFSSGAGRTSDGNGSHASTLKSPSYTKSVSWQHYPEAKIVQDADRLEALGAIGLARVFAVSGALGLALFDGEDPFAQHRPLDDKRYALDHFQTKLLKLPQTMQTARGKQLAQHNAQFLVEFMAKLGAELAGENEGIDHKVIDAFSPAG